MSHERLQKIMARAGSWSRRQAETLIANGQVTVNGTVAKLGDQADPGIDAIKVDGRRLHVPESTTHLYLLLNKPPGHISTRSDPEGRPTVLDLLPSRMRSLVRPVGRLDFDTEGLLLLTDDGELAHRVTHPRYGCPKTYEVKVKGRPDKASLDRLRGGIKIHGKPTAPAKIDALRIRGRRAVSTNSWWSVTLNEGRTRQIREMFFRIGHPVNRLRRVAIGPLRAGHLDLGSWRPLDDAELERLREAVGLGKAGSKGSKR